MARASAGVSKALAVGAVISVFALWGASGPAQADVGGVVGTATGAGGDAVGGVVGPQADSVTDPVTQVTDPVTHVIAPVTHAADPVTHAVTHAVAGPVATVQKATKPAADQPRAASTPQQTTQPVGAVGSGPTARTGSAAHTASTSPAARRSRHQADSRRGRRRPSAAPDMVRASALGEALLLASVRPPVRQQVVGASDTSAEQACRSASLTAADLLRCARLGVLLPNLGGPRTILLPISLALVSVGLVMVARGRRRHGPSVRGAV